jgi:GTP-binding protein EngB required for normal cell division
MIFNNFGDRFPTEMTQIKRCNILVIGNTGVGKSTLIGELCQMQIGNSINKTKNISDAYEITGQPIRLYDTPGMESSNDQRKKNKKKIDHFIEKHEQQEPEDQIHAVWYCVNSQVARPTEIDKSWIESITKKLPLIAVITRGSDNKAEEKWLKGFLKDINQINEVVTIIELPSVFTKSNSRLADLDEILLVTEKLLPKSAEQAISNAVNTKAKNSLKWHIGGSTSVLLPQLQPFPLIRTPFTLGFQSLMVHQIIKEFDLKFNNLSVKEILAIETIGMFGIENILNNLPINTDKIKTIYDFLNDIISTLNDISGSIPLKEQLVEFLNGALLNPVANLPVVNCMSSAANIFSTVLLGIAFIEMMKHCKRLEYEGKPQLSKEEFKKNFQDRHRYYLTLITQWFGENDFGVI